MSLVRLCAVVLGCCAGACGGGPEIRHLLSGAEIAPTTLGALHASLAGAVSPQEASEPPAIAVGSDTTGLWGLNLDASNDEERPWRHEARVTQPPVADRELTVFGDGPLLSALAAGTGLPLWSGDFAGAELLAVASSGKYSALLLRDTRRDQRWLSLLDESGAEMGRVDAESDLGIPAALGSQWIVPWGRSFVSALDVTGVELARARTDSTVSETTRQSGDLLIGGPPWTLLSTGVSIAWPRRPLPGRVAFSPEVPRPDDTTLTRVYVLGAGSASRELTFMATFRRFAVGLDGATGSLLWVQVLPSRVLAGAALEHGFALCDASGGVRIVAPRSGHAAARARLAGARRAGLPEPTLGACAISVGTLGARLTAQLTGPAPSPSGSDEEDASALVAQLARASSLPDSDLGDAQRFFSRELAARPEPEATRALIDLTMRRSADRVLQAEAEDLLATRRNGVEFMLESLSSGIKREKDPTLLPPLGALADALAALEEQRAAPLLAAQLNRPGHSADALFRAATALERLASPSELRELLTFFSLHRTTADFPDVARATTAIGRTLLRIGGERGEQIVSFAVRDPLTVPAVRAALEEELPESKREPRPIGR